MAGAIAHDQAQRLRAALEGVFRDWGDSLDVSGSARDAFLRLVEVLESSPEAVVLPSDTVFSTQKAADLLGVSRMTVVRLVDRGELAAEGGGVHRRIAVAELARYRAARLATTLLWVAEAGLFQPLWSELILDEVPRSLPKVEVTPEQASRRVGMMREAFGVEALIDGFDDLVGQMRFDPKDRHVLAASVRGGADTVVTFNLKDFPGEAGAAYGIGICHPDTFLVQLLGKHTDFVVATLKRETAAFRNPLETVTQFLMTLTVTVAALGQSGDLTYPARVAFEWWAGLLHDLDVAVISPTIRQPGPTTSGRSAISPGGLWPRRSFMPSTLSTRSHLRDSFPRSQIERRRAASQVFDAYLTPATFLTLIRVGNGNGAFGGSDQPFCLQETSSAAEYPTKPTSATP